MKVEQICCELLDISARVSEHYRESANVMMFYYSCLIEGDQLCKFQQSCPGKLRFYTGLQRIFHKFRTSGQNLQRRVHKRNL